MDRRLPTGLCRICAAALDLRFTQPIRALTIDHEVAGREEDLHRSRYFPVPLGQHACETKEQSSTHRPSRVTSRTTPRVAASSRRKSFSIDELKALGKVTRLTRAHLHAGMWTGIAQWEGIRLKDLLEQVTPRQARYLMATSFRTRQFFTDSGRPTGGPTYECIDPSMIDDDECISPWAQAASPCPRSAADRCACARRFNTATRWSSGCRLREVDSRLPRRGRRESQGGSREDSGLQHYDARAESLRLRAVPRLPPRLRMRVPQATVRRGLRPPADVAQPRPPGVGRPKTAAMDHDDVHLMRATRSRQPSSKGEAS